MLCLVYGVECTVQLIVQCSVLSVQCTEYSIQCTVHCSVNACAVCRCAPHRAAWDPWLYLHLTRKLYCTRYMVHSTLYTWTEHCSLYTVHFVLYTLYCTLYTRLYVMWSCIVDNTVHYTLQFNVHIFTPTETVDFTTTLDLPVDALCSLPLPLLHCQDVQFRFLSNKKQWGVVQMQNPSFLFHTLTPSESVLNISD